MFFSVCPAAAYIFTLAEYLPFNEALKNCGEFAWGGQSSSADSLLRADFSVYATFCFQP